MSIHEDRFWAKVDKKGPDECWPWIGGKTNGGYGIAVYLGKHTTAHRVAWRIANEAEIPEGLNMLHSCDNRPCCNPAHLSPGTQKENIRQAVERKRLPKMRITHCPLGHEYTPENIYRTTIGGRACRECIALRLERARAATRERRQLQSA